MSDNLEGYRWEGAACIGCLALGTSLIKFNPASKSFMAIAFALSILGIAFGLSYLRTWKPIFRFGALALLVVVLAAFYLMQLFPRR